MASVRQPRVYVVSSRRNRELNRQIRSLLVRLGFDVFVPSEMTDQEAPREVIFEKNVSEIKRSNLVVAILAKYGKDTAAEVGMAYGFGVPTIGVDIEADGRDIITVCAVDKMVEIGGLWRVLRNFRRSWVKASNRA